ncbi:MAG: hypothetical protein AB7D27_14605 [Desulfomicrobium sp.]
MHLFERKWNFSSMIPILAFSHVFFILGCASFSCAADVSWSKGDRAHVVVIHGSAVSIESGYVTALDGEIIQVRWDKSHGETLVPVEGLYRFRRDAQRAAKLHGKDDTSFDQAARSAGKMGLLYLLLNQRGRK